MTREREEALTREREEASLRDETAQLTSHHSALIQHRLARAQAYIYTHTHTHKHTNTHTHTHTHTHTYTRTHTYYVYIYMACMRGARRRSALSRLPYRVCLMAYGVWRGAFGGWRVTLAERLLNKALNLYTNQTKRAGSLACDASAAAAGEGGNVARDAARAGAKRGCGSRGA